MIDRASPEKLEVGNGFGVVAHGIAELNHRLTEVWEAVRVGFQLAGLHISKHLEARVEHARLAGAWKAQRPTAERYK